MARILFVTERFPPDIGGLATSGNRISATLSNMGHTVEVFALTNELDVAAAETNQVTDNLIVHRFGRAKQSDFTLQQSLIFLEWLHRESGNSRFDLVWSHYAWHNGFMGTWFAKQQSIPSVVSVRGNDLDRQMFPPGDLARLTWTLNNADKVVSVSKDLAAKINVLVGSNASVLYNSVNAEQFSPGEPPPELVQRYEIRNDELVLVFTGELRTKKGLPMLLECFRQMSNRRPTKLLVVGEVRAKQRPLFERETVGLGSLKKNLIVTGHIEKTEEIVDHLRLSDVFVLPSLWDGLPNSLLEAMAVGLPCVVSDAGAIPEVIEDGRNGMIVPKTHLHQMAGRIEEYFAKPATERAAITEAAREYVVVNHSPQLETDNLGEILKQLLQ